MKKFKIENFQLQPEFRVIGVLKNCMKQVKLYFHDPAYQSILYHQLQNKSMSCKQSNVMEDLEVSRLIIK